MSHKRAYITLILLGVVGGIGGLLGNLAAGELQDIFAPYKWLSSVLFGVCTLILIILSIWQFRVERDIIQVEDKHYRSRIVEKVKSLWINGWLKHSLQDHTKISIGKETEFNVNSEIWKKLSPQPLRKDVSHVILSNTEIDQIFDAVAGEILILGEPGAGKTTVLLELAQELIKRAEKNTDYEIPVVLRLAFWGKKHETFVEWLVDAFYQIYKIPKSIGLMWIEKAQVVLLLDGLDEVEESKRESCIDAINKFRQKYGMTKVVVSSRRQEYNTLKIKLDVPYVLRLLPLDRHQIESYLSNSREEFSSLRKALREDTVLFNSIQTPLMLAIAAKVYSGDQAKLPLMRDARQIRQHLFGAYVQHMVERFDKRKGYDTQRVIRYLANLARMITEYALTDFYIRWLDYKEPSPMDRVRMRVGRLSYQWLPKNRQFDLYYYYHLFSSTVIGICSGLIVGAAVALWVGWVDLSSIPIYLYFVFALFFLSGFIFLIDALSSNSEADVGLLVGLFVGSINGVAIGLIFGQNRGFVFALATIILGGLVAVIVNTLSKVHTAPLKSVIVGTVIGVSHGLVLWMLAGKPNDTISLVVFGCMFGLIGLLIPFCGSNTYDLLLRVMLYREGYIPWNYPRFLNYAAKCILLHRVGGKYVFIHDLLLEYFAELDIDKSKQNGIE
jgi:DNA polymerase III delta prime subunit